MQKESVEKYFWEKGKKNEEKLCWVINFCVGMEKRNY
jgi:hypothetical protein